MEGYEPTEKQIAFATKIAWTLGIDLPEEYSISAYSDFITENYREFQKITSIISTENIKEEHRMFRY